MRTAVASLLRTRALLGVLFIVALLTAGCTGPGRTGPPPPPPPPPRGAAAPVAFVERQIGKPYCSGGAGPSCFDCSGLTMRAWQAGGIALPHFSGAQYAMFPSVPLTQLQPGDLVFPADPSQHVAMYVGNRTIVHATHTGDFVRAEPLSEPGLGLVLAVRPG
jgi:cell wall-associated NlpC family hydrolase